MSRVAKKEIHIPTGVSITRSGDVLQIKGAKGALDYSVHPEVVIEQNENVLTVAMQQSRKGRKTSMRLAGTTRARVNNIIHGVTHGFEKKLTLVGVGYRAQAQGSQLNLTLGFSHPVVYALPKGVTVETPTQTEILVKGVDKVLVGQVAADIRRYRSPEPYKGKGVRYADEVINLKETKKK